MKKTILILLIIAFGNTVYSQCVPDGQYASETFGFWPQTSAEFDTAVVNTPYLQIVNIKAPINGGEIDPAYTAYDIDSISIVSVTGLPVGYDYTCNNTSCTIPGGEQACIQIAGTTDTAGDYPLNIALNIYVNISGAVIALPYNFTDYTLTVQLTDGIGDIVIDGADLGQNIPNPFSETTMIPYEVNKPSDVYFQVYNMMGERVFSETVHAASGNNIIEFNAESLNSGIYLYSITTNGYTQTKRMLLRK